MYKMDFTSVRHAGFSAKTAILALPANNRVKNETDKLIMELIFFYSLIIIVFEYHF